MIVRQLCVGRMAVFCYLVQDRETGDCALIDPAFETARILDAVKETGGRVTHVINTHGHADHVCGNAAIIRETGARLCIHKADAGMLSSWASKGFTRLLGGKPSPRADVILSDGDVIEIGRMGLEVIHTPGHSPGGVCLLGDGELFTGDTLFVGCIGATWFPGASLKQLRRSITERLWGLPDSTRVWPGHHYGVTPVSTIGWEKAHNPYVRQADLGLVQAETGGHA